MEEIWKDIKGYEGYYQVSNLGKIKSLKKNILIKQARNKNGYLDVSLWKNNIGKTFKVHRLVAESFILNSKNKPHVDHKNHNILDNRQENLSWCTPSENQANRIHNKNSTSKHKGVHWFKRDNNWHAQITKDYKKYHIGYFKNEKDAALAYNKKAIELFGKFALLNEVPY
jgi:phenolic acid decarboxylase